MINLEKWVGLQLGIWKCGSMFNKILEKLVEEPVKFSGVLFRPVQVDNLDEVTSKVKSIT